MKARLRQLASWLADTFWILPAVIVALGIVGGLALVEVDRRSLLPDALIENAWIYNGSAEGARALLGSIASSTIGVAGTAFSITIAALSLAAGQMGPRLLHNFTRDRGNQLTLGIFLGTFTYTLVVIRTVRGADEGEFVPHAALTVAILLAILCVAMLVYFIGHMAGRINVETVIDLVSDDVSRAIRNLTRREPGALPAPAAVWEHAVTVRDPRKGYLQHLDAEALADWADSNDTAVRLLVRPGDFVFPGAPIAWLSRPAEGADEAIVSATALSAQRVSSEDIEFTVRQVVEVAVRALSPGINDPMTANGALDRLGACLCELVALHLPTGVHLRRGRPALEVAAVDYDGLADSMFHLIRQNAAGSPTVLIHMLDVLTAVASCEREPPRVAGLRRHADLVLAEAEERLAIPADLDEVRARHRGFVRTVESPDTELRH